MSFFRKKLNTVTPTPTETDHQITESLYKQNLEIALKNKILSLLEKLYQISILALKPKDLAQRIAETLQGDLSFELVDIFLYDEEKDDLMCIAHAGSERAKINIDYNTLIFKKTSNVPLLNKTIIKHERGYTENIKDIWSSVIDENTLEKVQQEGHIKSSLVLPFVIENKVIGILVLSLNRVYDELVEFEKDSIHSFINVIALALDKALIYQKLEELNEQKTQFVSLATHQMRAPLTAIKGHASMILEGDYGEISDKIKNVATVIFNSAHNLVGVVGDYLDISRIELNKMQYDFVPVELNGAVKQVVAELQPIIMGKKLTLTFAPKEPTDPYNVSVDIGKIKQIVGNIIDNAIKYTPEGTIVVGLEKKPDHKVLISVKDTGVGVDKETIAKLFQRFTRADDAHATNVSGTGLGLYIVRQMVEAHEGRVWVESEGKGKGSQFYIEIPDNLKNKEKNKDSVLK
jgi:signal transduction histidine kinase